MTANELYSKGARVWIPDPEAIWRGAELLEDYTGQQEVKIQYEDGEESVLKIKDKNHLPHLRNPEILIGENDLTSLSYLNEPEVLYNLQVRFLEQNIIYTYCGIVLVAINPYADLPIYGNDIIHAYSGQDMGAMDPHIFAVAEEAYKHMSRFELNQSIIVSGESGAGKTVSAKYAMRYFAMVGGSQAETQVEKKVLASNPIMEAIGNAKTTRNDNSSRFGKYIEISFNKKNEIIGAHMRTYLLEKSRVVYQATEERNYHIFYQLCACNDLPEFKKFQLLTADKFFYTSHGGEPVINGVDDAEVFGETREALTMLGLSSKDQMMIFQILSAILHFGNVRIQEADGESSQIPAKDKHLTLMCQLLGIEESQMRMWLCNRKFTTVGEVLTKPLTSEQASNAQDALAKHVYAKLFDWIVDKVNLSLHSTTKQHRFIGVLDIYGFETFEVNSFEQFCINYANEKLQQIFNMHVFKLEQEEYVKEAIEWSFIDFYDNQPCIDLIESKLGILDLLDEECKMPKGSDQNWCQKLYDKHYNKAKHFDKPRMSNMAFIIHHFADKVTYQANGFLEKNRDTVLEDHINILRASEFELVAELFEEKPDPNEKKQRAGSAPTQPLRANPKGGKGMKKTVGSQNDTKATVGDQFRDSLFMLMDTLNATTPHYIRCIKPNDVKEAFEFDPKRAVEQLRACGVLETIRISAAGYPSRWTYSEFFQRYRVLARSKDIDKANPRKTCENVLVSVIQDTSPTKHRKTQKPIEDPDKYRFGKTKIFFRAGQVAYLEKLRSDKLRYCGIMIQKNVKGWLQRKRYRKITRSITLLQKYGRGFLARRYAKYLRETWAAKTIQKRWRGYQARRHYISVRKAVVILQASIRGFFGRREFEKALHTHRAVVIQRYARGWLARVRYHRVIRGIVKLQSHYRRRQAKKELKKLKIEAKSVDHIKNVNKGLENKIIQLQQQLDMKSKEVQSIKQHEIEVEKMRTELEKLRSSSGEAEKSSNKITELLAQIKALKLELEKEQIEKQDLISEKELLRKEKAEIANKLTEENAKLSSELQLAKTRLEAQENDLGDMIKEKVEAAKKQLLSEFESERSHHQRLVKEHARLQQRLENLHGEMEYLTSPQGHKRTPSDISAISLESYTSSVSPDDKKEEGDEDIEKEQDQGYGTEKSKKRKAPAPPIPTEKTAVNGETKDIDVGLLLKLQNRVKDLEKEKLELLKQLDHHEEDKQTPTPSGGTEVITDSAFNALKKQLVNADDVQLVIKLQKRIKDLELTKNRLASELDEREEDDEMSKFNITTPEFAYNNLKMQELENENDKLKREVGKLMKAISDSTNFDQAELSPSGKEFMDQFEAMTDELERRREECLQLRAMMAEKSITTHAIAKESYGGNDNIVNEDNELAMAYRTQKELNRLLNKSREEMTGNNNYRTKQENTREAETAAVGQNSAMGTSPSSCETQSEEEDDDKSLTSNYSTQNGTLWNNKKSAPLIGGNSVSVEYLDLVNETSGFWTFDDSVKTRVSHVLYNTDFTEDDLLSHDREEGDLLSGDRELKCHSHESTLDNSLDSDNDKYENDGDDENEDDNHTNGSLTPLTNENKNLNDKGQGQDDDDNGITNNKSVETCASWSDKKTMDYNVSLGSVKSNSVCERKDKIIDGDCDRKSENTDVLCERNDNFQDGDYERNDKNMDDKASLIDRVTNSLQALDNLALDLEDKRKDEINCETNCNESEEMTEKDVNDSGDNMDVYKAINNFTDEISSSGSHLPAFSSSSVCGSHLPAVSSSSVSGSHLPAVSSSSVSGSHLPAVSSSSVSGSHLPAVSSSSVSGSHLPAVSSSSVSGSHHPAVSSSSVSGSHLPAVSSSSVSGSHLPAVSSSSVSGSHLPAVSSSSVSGSHLPAVSSSSVSGSHLPAVSSSSVSGSHLPAVSSSSVSGSHLPAVSSSSVSGSHHPAVSSSSVSGSHLPAASSSSVSENDIIHGGMENVSNSDDANISENVSVKEDTEMDKESNWKLDENYNDKSLQQLSDKKSGTIYTENVTVVSVFHENSEIKIEGFCHPDCEVVRDLFNSHSCENKEQNRCLCSHDVCHCNKRYNDINDCCNNNVKYDQTGSIKNHPLGDLFQDSSDYNASFDPNHIYHDNHDNHKVNISVGSCGYDDIDSNCENSKLIGLFDNIGSTGECSSSNMLVESCSKLIEETVEHDAVSCDKLTFTLCVQGHVSKSHDCCNAIKVVEKHGDSCVQNISPLTNNQNWDHEEHSLNEEERSLCEEEQFRYCSCSPEENNADKKPFSDDENLPNNDSLSTEEDMLDGKHFCDQDLSADDEHFSAEDGAYMTCSDNEQDTHFMTESFIRNSQPESGFGETITSEFISTHNLEQKLCELEVENYQVPGSETSFDADDYHHGNCLQDDLGDIDWDGGSICGCPECLGRLRIERIITADKCTMCPEDPPYVLMCEICEELLENQLQKTEKDSKKKEADLKKQLKGLKEENEKQQKVIQQNLQLGPEAKIEATMQHEITRLTSENLDLRESLDKNQDQIRKLKKMLKVYAKRLKDGEAAEIAAELDKDDTQSNVENVASIKHRERNYMGMLEYRKEDESALIKNLIMDLKPRVAVGLLPGLPAYVLFMCVRHTDYVNDDEKVRGLLTNTINGIKKCVKKHHSDLERVMLWLANTCRLLHTLKQYSGEKGFQSENSPRQNEHCLRNFDLSEYRQVFSDLAVWIYQTLIKQMQETVQQMIVPAVLEHEAIAGLTASKPSGMRGRSSSNATEVEDKELSLDSMMKVMNKYSQILAQHAVDPELVKQIFRQLYYIICAGALNNLLLRKDMCNWSKGMQIRYNLSHLEQWLRDNKLQESGALTALEPITQASQLLQARKTDADVDSICEMCSKLTTAQIVKILNLYTPVDEFEERVPISFIRKIQQKLKGRQEADNTLLMDTKYSFPVTFPFNPSSIALETIEVPEQLHLGFLIRH